MSKVCADLIGEDENINRDHIRNLFFGNYIEPDADPKCYDEVSFCGNPWNVTFKSIIYPFKITDLQDLTEKMNYYLDEHNMISRSPMNLVMFKFAIEHVSRVSRVLQQDNGNAMLVGIGGSGRHSAVKLATFMCEFYLFEVKR